MCGGGCGEGDSDMTNPNATISTFFADLTGLLTAALVVVIVVTALQWSRGEDRVITVWRFFFSTWYDNVKRFSRLLQ